MPDPRFLQQRQSTLRERLSQSAPQASGPVWQVGALCRAVADVLNVRFGLLTVTGELSGFMRAGSGHCYFQLKDSGGQLRCAMFRRAADTLNWQPRDGDQVQLRGRLAVYEARGDLQLIVDSMQRAGQGALYEDFLRRKAALERQGLFDPARKRQPGAYPRAIGVVTSLNTAAVHDVLTALRRRAPHVPVVLVPALVQGVAAPQELIDGLQRLYALVRRQQQGADTGVPAIDTILLVRGGGSLEDLWAFNDEQLAHTIVDSPVPLISGVGHETDFTIADFCADLRAPTPTAAAELAAMPRQAAWQQARDSYQRLQQWLWHALDGHAQGLDRLGWRMARNVGALQRQRLQLQELGARLRQQQQQGLHGQRMAVQALQARLQQALARQMLQGGQRMRLQGLQHRLQAVCQMQRRQHAQLQENCRQRLLQALQQRCQHEQHRLAVAGRSLHLLGPQQPLQRGYALLLNAQGQLLRRQADFAPGQPVRAQMADGQVGLRVDAVQNPAPGA